MIFQYSKELGQKQFQLYIFHIFLNMSKYFWVFLDFQISFTQIQGKGFQKEEEKHAFYYQINLRTFQILGFVKFVIILYNFSQVIILLWYQFEDQGNQSITFGKLISQLICQIFLIYLISNSIHTIIFNVFFGLIANLNYHFILINYQLIMSSQKNDSKVRSKISTIMMNMNIAIGSLNIGYVLSYLTLSIDTLFANLQITEEERTSKLSLLNGILPLGCVAGVLIGYIIKQKLTNKQCLQVADVIGIFSLLATISNYQVIVAVRFFLGISNGISSLIMPVYIKSLCPSQYFSQMSMLVGYGINTGLAIGQLMGIGYINYNGPTSNWWRVVFLFPSIICIFRQLIIHFIYNYESPEQLIKRGNYEQAKYVICQIYKLENVEEEYERYTQLAQQQYITKCLKNKNQQPFKSELFLCSYKYGVALSLVFYYSAQIFSDLSDNDITQKTIYTICLGLSGFLAQFSTIYMVNKIGSKYILMIGSLIIGSLNLAVSVISRHASEGTEFLIFILLLLLIMTFAATLGPVAWSIVPQINDSDGTFISTELRWSFQAILIFCFPFLEKGIKIFGGFLLFAIINFLYFIYCHFCLIDGRGKTNEQLVAMYHNKYGYSVVPLEKKNTQANLQTETPNTQVKQLVIDPPENQEEGEDHPKNQDEAVEIEQEI
ncbi:unnamed protein product (macronuclear) [Paramecium tetraurelia]|uniref:Hexose transporter 1 n=1 Tax=Paramecium tetraurelia TaxID=5888 RepID=A0DLL5_PARTE|nr:uncharacterized protein GSPATT00018250001 [Paramecium tetraurelia]CAK83932.1 unnamed protein product [Paramecium tetraurelia]|eukprot:XP_001451329.1 hypothetical protein (macronuclear) [Paramecium tetraurelia strain d4-2]